MSTLVTAREIGQRIEETTPPFTEAPALDTEEIHWGLGRMLERKARTRKRRTSS